jgi:hypothetical protein
MVQADLAKMQDPIHKKLRQKGWEGDASGSTLA